MINKDQGGLTYEDWAAMTPWQRDDFIIRMNRFLREQEQKRKEEAERAKQNIKKKK